MLISDMIAELEQIKGERGDLPIWESGCGSEFCEAHLHSFDCIVSFMPERPEHKDCLGGTIEYRPDRLVINTGD